MNNENKEEVKQEEPRALTNEELYARMDEENWHLKAENRELREQNDLLRRMINTQIWLIDEYQRQLKRAGYADMTSRGI